MTVLVSDTRLWRMLDLHNDAAYGVSGLSESVHLGVDGANLRKSRGHLRIGHPSGQCLQP